MTKEELLERIRLEDRFNKIIDKYTYEYVKANTKSKKNIISYDLLSLSKICTDYFSIFKFDLPWSEDEDLYEEQVGHYYKFIYNIIKNKDKYLKIFYSSMYNILPAGINNYKYYGKTCPRHKEKELDYIFCDFLNKFDPKSYQEYVKLIDSENIFYAPLHGYNGIHHPFSMLNDNMIFLSSAYDNNIEFYKTLSHELGHALEAILYLNSGKEKDLNNTFNSPFYEVSSSFMEYAYINYLLENNIYKEEAKLLLHDYYIELLLNSIYANIICRITDIENEFDEELNIDIKEFNTYLTTLERNYNLYDMFVKDKVSLEDPFIYGFGQLFSIYLYENYKKDPNYFKKEFSKSLLEYSQTEDMSSFERVGITYDNLVKGDTLKKVLTRNS